MNDLSTAINSYQQGEGGIKENPPCTPLKENKGRSSLFSVSVSVSHAPTRTRARDAADTKTETGTRKPSLQTETETGCLRNVKTETVQSRPTVDAELILRGYHSQGRYDAVQTAMYVFGIPPQSNGYDNAPVLRWHLRRLGEERFREIVYQQWRENQIDGAPRNTMAALTVKLFKAGGDVK